MEEKNLFEVYGVPKPEETEAQQPDAQAAQDEGGNESGQTKEENAGFAAARRKAERERDAAVQKAKQEADARVKSVLAKARLVNPYTKQPITTEAELDAWDQANQQKIREKLKRDGNLSDEDYDALVQGTPEVRRARQVVERDEAAQREQMRRQVEQEMQEITRLDPEITDLQALARQPDYAQIYEKVEQGYSLIDAFRTVRFDRLKGSASTQAALNRAGKEHMAQTKARGDGSLMVPERIKQNYRALNPRATDEQIAQHYNRMMRERGD